MSSTKEPSISSITPLTSENYRSWADDIKSWPQLNGLWCLVSGWRESLLEGLRLGTQLVMWSLLLLMLDEDKLERWEIKAEKAAGAPQDCHVLRCQSSHQGP